MKVFFQKCLCVDQLVDSGSLQLRFLYNLVDLQIFHPQVSVFGWYFGVSLLPTNNFIIVRDDNNPLHNNTHNIKCEHIP